ncbi:selenocysteine-specific translation elongation factor [Pullulanibacillus camelliae]|nr:selenocysteine-specific translation elongation factor [Pullulanibacillus camelliae]
MKRPITIGVAGHIDHGKTALTKALTHIETDRLAEEKERNISIENGYAFFDLEPGWRAAVIDVPGHERFIRKMIAGVAGVDVALFVIAADEGMMPQTREHLAILELLGITPALFVVTKSDKVDAEMLSLAQHEIVEYIQGSIYENAAIYCVDSLSGRGIETLKQAIRETAMTVRYKGYGKSLRLPIDDVFTLHGHGTIIRGTIFDGKITNQGNYELLPAHKKLRIKQLQVHHERVNEAISGQRVAVNVAGVEQSEVKRGDVLVTPGAYHVTQRIDIQLHTLSSLQTPLKQRMPITLHIGTSQVRGNLILFDRQRLKEGTSVVAQLALDAQVVTQRGDRFILRRPTPAETIGGGEVLDADAPKHRFGEQTVEQLSLLAKGTPETLLLAALEKQQVMSEENLKAAIRSFYEDEGHQLLQQLQADQKIIAIDSKQYLLGETYSYYIESLLDILKTYHERYPLKFGMPRSEWFSRSPAPAEITQTLAQQLVADKQVVYHGPLVSWSYFVPHYPKEWARRLEQVKEQLKGSGLQAAGWAHIVQHFQLPEDIATDYKYFLLNSGEALQIEEDQLVDKSVFTHAIEQLRQKTAEVFTLQEAREVLELSRKYLIPFLEMCDALKITTREGHSRRWL